MAKTSKKDRSTQKIWIDKINRAKKVRAEWKKRFKVDLGREYFEGQQMPPGADPNEWITINKIYSHLKTQLPALYSVDPYFYVRLRRCFQAHPMLIARYEAGGKVRQGMLNYLKEKLVLKEKAQLCIQDAHFAYGVAKTRFKADSVDNPDAGKPFMADDGNTMFDDDGNPVFEPEIITINDRYDITRIHPDDMLWDEDAGPLEDSWTWLAQRIRMTVDDARKNPLYRKSALKSLEGKSETQGDEEKAREKRQKGNDVKGRSERMDPHKPGTEKPEQPVVFWEIYLLKEKKWITIAEGADVPVMPESDIPEGVDKHPYSILRFTWRDDSPYPIPPISMGLDPQKEFNSIRSKIQTHRKRFNRKYVVVGPAFEDAADATAKLSTGSDGTVLISDRPIGESPVYAIQDAPLDQMTYSEVGMLNNDMIELLGGSGDEARGIAGADSATQAGIMDKRLEIKEGDAMSRVIDFIKSIARKLDMLVEVNLTTDEAVLVTGPQGEFWQVVRQQDYEQIEGEYEYTVNVGATLPRLPQMERSSWMAFLTLLSTFPHLMINEHLLKRMAEMHHIEDEAMIAELRDLGMKILKGEYPMPGQQGSQAGQGETRPVSSTGGQAGGAQSLNLPGAGNLQ